MRARLAGLAGASVLAFAGLTGTAVAAPPTCSTAENYVMFASVNEANEFAGIYGRGWTRIQNGSTYCIRDFNQNRTWIRVVHIGRNYGGYGDLEYVTIDTYTYNGFESCGPGAGGPVYMGNATLYYDQSDGVRRTHTYATPCE